MTTVARTIGLALLVSMTPPVAAAQGFGTIRADWLTQILRAGPAPQVRLYAEGRRREQQCLSPEGRLYQCKNAYTILFALRQAVQTMPRRHGWRVAMMDRLSVSLAAVAARIQVLRGEDATAGLGVPAGSVDTPPGSALWHHDLLFEPLEPPRPPAR